MPIYNTCTTKMVEFGQESEPAGIHKRVLVKSEYVDMVSMYILKKDGYFDNFGSNYQIVWQMSHLIQTLDIEICSWFEQKFRLLKLLINPLSPCQ